MGTLRKLDVIVGAVVAVAIGVGITLILLAGPPRPVPAAGAHDPSEDGAGIQYAWTQLVSHSDTTRILLRVIVADGAGCERLARYAKSGATVVMKRRPNPHKERFRIDLCEALLDLDDAGVRLKNGSALTWESIADRPPNRIAVIGDSGCRTEAKQSCGEPKDWGFPRVTAAASFLDEGPPDLTIHVGDYRYRGSDDWSNWKADFFEPMRPLLAAAPFVAVRGNHDNCYRGKGFGWKYLLAPTTEFADCPKGGTAEIEPSYALRLGDLHLVVIDSADTNYRCKSWDASVGAENGKYLKALSALLDAPDRRYWLLSHYPIFDVRTSEACSQDASASCPTCDSLWPFHERIVPLLLGRKIDAVISGDIHDYRAMHVETADAAWKTLQFVVGHSGAILDQYGAIVPGCRAVAPPQSVYCAGTLGNNLGYKTDYPFKLRRRNVFGFMAAVRDATGKVWRFDMRTATRGDQKDEAECLVPAGGLLACIETAKPPG